MSITLNVAKASLKIFLKILLKYFATIKNYLHLCIAKQIFKKYMLQLISHIERATRFSLKGDYTVCGACTLHE